MILRSLFRACNSIYDITRCWLLALSLVLVCPYLPTFVIASSSGRGNPHTLVIASHNVTWQSSLRRYAGCPSDTAGCLRARWIAASPHSGLLAMTGVWGAPCLFPELASTPSPRPTWNPCASAPARQLRQGPAFSSLRKGPSGSLGLPDTIPCED